MASPKKWQKKFSDRNRDSFSKKTSPQEKSSPKKEASFEKKSNNTVIKTGVRLNKYIANCGVCSRRDADVLIANGEIQVNGTTITEMGFKVQEDDTVTYNDKELKREVFQYILLNKPKDCVTTTKDTHDRRTVLDLVADACSERIYPVGRLDRNTTGILLLTNDGDLAKRLTHPSHEVKKIYIAKLDKDIDEEDIKLLEEGVTLEDGESKFDEAKYAQITRKDSVLCVLHSGKNRIVRRTFDEIGFQVINLDRVEFAGIKKGNLERGKWRHLSQKEIGFLKMS